MSQSKDDGRAPSGQALVASEGAAAHLHPSGVDPSRWLEIRPDSRGEFDEVYVRFADGMFCMETMTDKSVWIGLELDDGRYCHVWISSNGKLRYAHEDGAGEPPRFTAWGVDRKPWLASAIEAATAGETTKIGSTEGESAVPDRADAQQQDPTP